MGESTKVISALVLIVAVIVAAFSWTVDQPDGATWAFRIGSLILALLSLGLILKLQFRSDLVHDYLRDVTGTYFNRDGFCFAFSTTSIDDIAYMDAYFQNQRDQPCVGRIALRPAEGFLMGREKFVSISYEVECGPAEFGVARIAVPVPEKLQGKRQSFEVGVSVEFPNGKGKLVRFRDGVFLRTNTKFGNSLETAHSFFRGTNIAILFSKPKTTTVQFPFGVAEQIPDNLVPEIKTLWKLGDPPLEI